MKTIIKILLAIVIAIGVGAPYVMGRMIEEDFHRYIENLNRAHEGEFKVTGKFARGYFDSTATTEITFANSYTAYQFAHFIQHGPVIFNFSGWFSPSTYIPRGFKRAVINTKLAGNQQAMLTSLYGGKEPYEVITDISMQGDVATQFTNFPLTLNLGMGSLTWQGFTGNLNTHIDSSSFDGKINLPMIQYIESLTPELKQSVSLNNINITFADQTTDKLEAGKLTIDSIKVMVNDIEQVNLQQYSLSFDRRTTGNLLNVELIKDFAKLTLGDEVYGPFKLTLKLNNWDALAAAQLMQEPDQGFVPESNEPITVVPDAQLIALLANKIGISFDLSLDSQDGKIITNNQTELGGPGITAIEAKQILPTLTSTSHLEVSKKILYRFLSRYADNQLRVRESSYYAIYKTSTIKNPYTLEPEERKTLISNWISSLVAELMARNLLIAKGDDFITDVKVANEIITINGSTKTKEELEQMKPMLEVLQVTLPPPPSETPPASQDTVPAPSTPDAANPPSTSGTAPIPVASPPAAAPAQPAPTKPAPVTPNPPTTSNPGPSTPSGPSVTSVTNVKE